MKNQSYFIFVICGIILSSCFSTLEDPATVNPDEELKVSLLGVQPLKVSTTDSVNIIARIPKDAGPLDVSFTTTLGIFPKTAAKTIKEYADSISGDYRIAHTTLKPGTDAGTAYVTVEVTTQRRRLSIIISK